MNRRLRKAKNFYIYVVVFVAFVNACFFMPMEAQAATVGGAESLVNVSSSDFNNSSGITYVSGQSDKSIVNIGWSNDTRHILSLRFRVSGVDVDFANGNYFLYTARCFFWSNNNVSSHSYLDRTVYPDTFSVLDPNPAPGITFSTGSFVTYNQPQWDEFGGSFLIAVAGDYNYILDPLDFSFDMRLHYWGVDAPKITSLGFRLDSQSLVVVDTRSQAQDILEQIENNTGETTDAVINGFNQAMNGYNDSAGSQVASDLGNSASGYEQAEGNLFQGSESSLSGFEFFDFSGYTGITTGLSFVSTMMQSIYSNLGGMSGIGIVISVLFSVMFLAIVIGLYRYFK